MMKKSLIFGSLFIILFISGCSVKFGRPAKNVSEIKKNILMVIAPLDFRDAEYFTPKRSFEDEGFVVRTTSIQSGIAKGADGGEAKIDLIVGEVNPEDFAAVVFIGGPGMALISDDESLQTLAIKFVKAGKLTAAICAAPAVLAHAGLLTDIKATSHPGVKQVLEDNGARFINQSVVMSGNLITANGPDASNEFASQIIDKLATFE